MTLRDPRRSTNVCRGCGGGLAHRRADAKWCGAACSSRARKERDRHGYLLKRAEWHASRGRWLRHGLDPEKAEALLAEGCAVCGAAFPTRSSAHVDHDHSCCPGATSCGGCFRGLLCHGCNIGLGGFKDDPRRLAAAIAYLAGGAPRLVRSATSS